MACWWRLLCVLWGVVWLVWWGSCGCRRVCSCSWGVGLLLLLGWLLVVLCVVVGVVAVVVVVVGVLPVVVGVVVGASVLFLFVCACWRRSWLKLGCCCCWFCCRVPVMFNLASLPVLLDCASLRASALGPVGLATCSPSRIIFGPRCNYL